MLKEPELSAAAFFNATISIREADSFNQLIMNVWGACSDRTVRPPSAPIHAHTHNLTYHGYKWMAN